MFSETRYALNGDLRVAYRTTREGPCDMVFVPKWFTYRDVLPEVPSIRGWAEAMTSSSARPASAISSPSLLCRSGFRRNSLHLPQALVRPLFSAQARQIVEKSSIWTD